MKRRLFLALPLDEESRKVFRQFRSEMEAVVEGAHWVPEKNLHLTLLFMGSLAEELLPVLAAELEGLSMETAAFDLEFDRYEIRYKRSQPLMIWARYLERKAFSSLATRAQRLIAEWVPLPAPHSQQIPHVTLARFRSGKRKGPRLAESPRPQKLRVSELLLYESVLGAADPVYIPLQRFPLLH